MLCGLFNTHYTPSIWYKWIFFDSKTYLLLRDQIATSRHIILLVGVGTTIKHLHKRRDRNRKNSWGEYYWLVGLSQTHLLPGDESSRLCLHWIIHSYQQFIKSSKYHYLHKEIQSYGIDEIFCLSINDDLVLCQWGLHLGLEDNKTQGSIGFTTIQMIPDGATLFTRAMGMSILWNTKWGSGELSWWNIIVWLLTTWSVKRYFYKMTKACKTQGQIHFKFVMTIPY